MSRVAKDHTGLVYGRLTVLSENLVKKDIEKCRRFWECLCECGNTLTVSQDNLLRKKGTKSCGCLVKELLIQRNIQNTSHGLSAHPLYRIWNGMRQRCNNSNSYAYMYYGGKGIRVCEEWNDPETFIRWGVSTGYKEGLTIDRINGNDNYYPGNCRWVTRQEQTQNRPKKYTKRK